MADKIVVPDTTKERTKKLMVDFVPHPDSPAWFNKEKNETVAKRTMWASPYDARFPQFRRQKHCFAYYVDYYRCLELMGEDYKPCKWVGIFICQLIGVDGFIRKIEIF